MKDDIRFMDELFRIIHGALRLDIGKVRNYSEFLADKLEKSGDISVAKRLRKLLTETDHGLHPASLKTIPSIPVDAESRFPLIERVKADVEGDTPLVLSQGNWDLIKEFLSVAKSHAQIEAAGVLGSQNLLLYGPPGCGKSRLARYIADELDADLYVVRLDGVISSYLAILQKISGASLILLQEHQECYSWMNSTR